MARRKPVIQNYFLIFFILNIIMIFTFYLVYSFRTYGGVDEWNPDFLLYTIEGKDILGGNLILQDWWGSNNTFYFLGMIYAVFGSVFGFTTKLMSVVSAVLFSLFVFLLDLSIYEWEKSDRGRIGKILFFHTWLLVSFYFDGGAQASWGSGRGIFAGIHLDAALVDMYFFYLTAKAVSAKKVKKWYYVIYVVCFLAFLSDGLSVLYAVAPFFLVLIWNLLSNDDKECNKKLFFYFSILALTFVAASLCIRLWSGMKCPNELSISMIDYDSLFEKIAYTIEEIFYVFGGDFFGRILGRDMGMRASFHSLFAVMMACITLFFLLCVLRQIKQLRKDILCQFCFAVDVVFLLIFVFTTYTRTSISIRFNSRLCHVFIIATLILFSRVDLALILEKTKLNYHIWNILAAALMSAFVFKAFTVIPGKADAVTKFQDAAGYLKEKGLKCGCVSYEEYSPMIVASGFNIDFVCVGQEKTDPYHILDDHIYIKKWQCKVPKTIKDVRFAIFRDDEWDGVSAGQLIEQAGEPSEKQDFDDIHIYVWDRDISSCILEVHG